MNLLLVQVFCCTGPNGQSIHRTCLSPRKVSMNSCQDKNQCAHLVFYNRHRTSKCLSQTSPQRHNVRACWALLCLPVPPNAIINTSIWAHYEDTWLQNNDTPGAHGIPLAENFHQHLLPRRALPANHSWQGRTTKSPLVGAAAEASILSIATRHLGLI